MSLFNDVVKIGSLGLIDDFTGEDAAAAAAAKGAEYNKYAIDYMKERDAQTREDLMPFLEAGTGALGDYQADISGSPLAPVLNQFQFDVGAAMDSPELAWQREMGEQQMDRVHGKNRQLGSGNRLYDVTRFGQGLAAQSLDDQYNRQFNTWGANQNTDIKNYSLASDRYRDRMNRLAGLIDVGRGTGSALGSLGANTGSNVAGLLSNTGQLYGAAEMAGYQGLNNILNMGASALGGFYGAGGSFGGSGGGYTPSGNAAPGYGINLF